MFWNRRRRRRRLCCVRLCLLPKLVAFSHSHLIVRTNSELCVSEWPQHWHDRANSFHWVSFFLTFPINNVICAPRHINSARTVCILLHLPTSIVRCRCVRANEFVIESLKCNQNLIYVVRFCSWPPKCIFFEMNRSFRVHFSLLRTSLRFSHPL